ncbi:carboxymuconolactone decarboxylase family protein [Candidatus Poribacteria bacterium]|nr:carboxymuconolactone decarboxylase family protein [Candidatus Poribacteria bacterium]
MARIPYADIEKSSQKVREFFEKIETGGFEVLNINKMVAHSGAAVREFVRLGSKLIIKSHLEPRYRELAILKIAQIHGANYEWAHHVPIAMQAGVTLEQIGELKGWRGSAAFTSQEKTVLKYTEEVSRENQPRDETFAAASGFLDNASLVELTLSVGFWGMVARFLLTFHVDLEESFLQENADLLREVGHV